VSDFTAGSCVATGSDLPACTDFFPAWCDSRFANPDIFTSVGKLP
jgi:hypothetical protein